MPKKNIPEKCLEISGLFEAELLTELMLRFWNHPWADDKSFRSQLLEMAAEVLKASVNGQKFIEDIPPDQMNLVAAIWYVEWNSVNEIGEDPTGKRKEWLKAVQKGVPSCFCNLDQLGGPEFDGEDESS